MGKILELVMKYEIGDNHQKVDKDKADENMQKNIMIKQY